MANPMGYLGTADGAVLRCIDIISGSGRKRGCYTRDEVNELLRKLETAHQAISAAAGAVTAAAELEREREGTRA